MQSKKSSSKGALLSATLLKKNLSRFWPLWGGASLAGCVLPLYLLLNLLSPYYYSNRHATPSMMAQSLYGVFCYAVPIISLLYAILCAMVVWSYLYNARSVGLMHSLPVDRRCLFLTNTLSGLAMMLLPYVIVGSFTVLICIGFHILPPLAVLKVAVGIMGLSIFYFATATLCAHLTSHIFALPVFYFIGHFFAVGFHALISNFAANFIFGYVGGSAPDWVQFFSPTVFLTNGVLNMGYIPPESLDAEGTYVLNGMWAVGVYTLIGIALLAAAFLLYRLRHSESAGEVVAYRALKPIFRYGVALASALTLGQLLYEILWRMPFQTGAYAQMLPMGVCMVIAAILGYYIASMLLKKSLRVFRGNWQGPLTTAAIVVILCGCVSFDVFGSVSYVPDLQEVDDVIISFYDRSFSASGDSRLAQEIAAAHRAILKDEAYIRSMTSDGGYAYTMDESGVQETMETTLYLSYRMKDGTMVQRRYDMPLVRDRWYNQPDTFDYLLRQAVYGPEASDAAVTPVLGDTLDSLYGEYWNNDTGDVVTFNLTSDGAQRIYDGLLADAAAGTLYDDDIFRYDYYYNNGISGNLEFSFRYWSEETMSREVEFVRVDLSPTMTNTMAALKEEVPEWFAGLSEASQLSAFPDTVSAET